MHDVGDTAGSTGGRTEPPSHVAGGGVRWQHLPGIAPANHRRAGLGTGTVSAVVVAVRALVSAAGSCD